MIKTHDFQDLMGVSIETEDKWLNKKLNSHICYGKGGGRSQQQDVPPTLQPYIVEILDRASDLYSLDKQYIPYEGERLVGFTPEELAAQEAIKGQVGMGILGDETLGAASTYYDPALDLLGLSGQLSEQAVSEITAEEIAGRMSPFQQAVTDIAKREAAKEADIYDQRLKAQAAGTGGFGGSRQAILEAQAAADLGARLSDIQTKGSQAAYQDAVRAAEAQRARQAAGAQAAGGLSQLYGGLGQQALGQAYREAGYLSGVGEAQRGMEQQRADLAYQEFMRQQQFPTQQLQQFSSLVQGFPFSFGNYGQQVPSPFQQTVGTGLAAYGLGRNLGFFSEGGNIKPPVTVEDGEVTRNAAIGAVIGPAMTGLRGLASLPGRVPNLIDKASSLGARAVKPFFTKPKTTKAGKPLKDGSREFSLGRGLTYGAGFGFSAPYIIDALFGEEDKEEQDDKNQKTGTGTGKGTAEKGTGKKDTMPSYLSAYNDSIKLLKQRQEDIAGRREEGKAAIDEAFNLQLISLGTLIATTPKDKLYEKLPSEITKFTKKKDLVELQDKYDKQELTNLLAQASMGESLSKIISEVGESGLPTSLGTEITRMISTLNPLGVESESGQKMYNAALDATQQLSKAEAKNSAIRTRVILDAISKIDPRKSETVDALEGARGLK